MILLVDDEVFVLELMKRKLMAENYNVETAQSVEVAMKLLRANVEIKILVTDLHFDDGSGAQLLAWALENRPDVQRVILSAHTYEDWVRSETKALSNHVLTKPINVEETLIPLLNKLLTAVE